MSCPARTFSMSAASRTSFAIGPRWSVVAVVAGSWPKRLTRPYVGLMPTTPQYAAGMRIDPLLSVPTEPKISDALTAAAEPPLEPPGTQLSFHGLWTGPKADFTQVPPIAHSWRLFLPTMT